MSSLQKYSRHQIIQYFPKIHIYLNIFVHLLVFQIRNFKIYSDYNEDTLFQITCSKQNKKSVKVVKMYV